MSSMAVRPATTHCWPEVAHGAHRRRTSVRRCGICRSLGRWIASWRMAAHLPWQLSEFARSGHLPGGPLLAQAMDVICDRSRDQPAAAWTAHVDPAIASRAFRLPVLTARTSVQNVGIDSAWRGTTRRQQARAAIMPERIESHQALTFWSRKAAPIQEPLFI